MGAEMERTLHQNGTSDPLKNCHEVPQPVAVVGMACRLPGGASNTENLWTELANAQSGWGPHPADRYQSHTYYHPNADKKGCFELDGAHYLERDIARFDAKFFNVTAAEATVRVQLWGKNLC